jgi:hypothetical protein
MDRVRATDSGIFGRESQEGSSRFEPETVILVIAWLLAMMQIAVGVSRGEGFGTDRAAAIAFAIACPLLARRAVMQGAKRLARLLRGR